jgi:hypothetical protein
MAQPILSRIRKKFQENPWPAVIAASITVQKLCEAGQPLRPGTRLPDTVSGTDPRAGCRVRWRC